MRWARAEIDPGAIAHNVSRLRRAVAPAELWAVVKADGYGHGAVTAATAAVGAGASGLCVALVEEGVELRRAGVVVPILVLSEQPPETLPDLVAHGLSATAHRAAHVDALAEAARSAGGEPVPVHLKVDTGMQRVGARPDDLPALVDRVAAAPGLVLAGVFTHLALADEPTAPANELQLGRFDRALAAITAPALVHAANSAGALAIPASRRSLVRCGIAIYGISPGTGVDALAADLLPALRLVARVSHVKRVEAGSHVSYGWRHRFERDTTVATVPIGYADGVPRRLGGVDGRPGGEVLIGGRRRPIVGVVTMDQLMVDVGEADDGSSTVEVGDEVVLIGRQGPEQVRAEEWADRLGTIGYEIVCGIAKRVPRVILPSGGRP